MLITVQAGQTYNLAGYLGTNLYAQASDISKPSTLVTVSANATIGATGDVTLAAYSNGKPVGHATGATLAVGGTLTNNGVIFLQGGRPGYYGTTSGTGAILNDTGVLINNGLFGVGAAYASEGRENEQPGIGAQANFSGTFDNSGTLDILSSYSGYDYNVPGGTVSVTGTLNNSGILNVYASHAADITAPANAVAYSQPGVLKIGTTGVLTNTGTLLLLGGPDYGFGTKGVSIGGSLIDAGKLTNNATLIVQGGFTGSEYKQYTGTGGSVSITSSGKLTNNGLLALEGAVYGKGPFYYNKGTGATLTNSGVLANAGTLTVAAVQATGFSISGPSSNDGAAMLINIGTLSNTGTILLEGADVYNGVGYGGKLDDKGTFNNFGQVIVAGASLPPSYYLSQSYGARLAVSGTLANNGTILVGGAVNEQPDYPYLTGGTVLVTGTLTNQKMIEVQGGQTPAPLGKTGPYTAGGQLTNNAVLNNFGTIKLDGGIALHDRAGTLTNTGTLTSSGTINGGGTLINLGTILSGIGFTANIASTGFLNAGTVKVTPGAGLRIDSAVTAAVNTKGTFQIASGGTLTFNNSVGLSQTALFLAAGPETLLLNNAATFSGILSNLHPTDRLDLLHTNVTAATATGTNLKLAIAGGGTITLKLAAPLPSTDTLKLSSDGAGGTNLTIGTKTLATPTSMAAFHVP